MGEVGNERRGTTTTEKVVSLANLWYCNKPGVP